MSYEPYRNMLQSEDEWNPSMMNTLNFGPNANRGRYVNNLGGRNSNNNMNGWRPQDQMSQQQYRTNNRGSNTNNNLTRSPQNSPSWNSNRMNNKKPNIRRVYGLLDKNRMTPIHFKEATIKGTIIGPFSRMNVIQYYQNTEQTPVEAEYVFPLAKYATVTDFSIEIDDRKFISRIVDDDQTMSYNDTLLFPQSWTMLEEANQNIFKVCIGKLLPNSTVSINISYVGELLLRENELTFNFSSLLFPSAEANSRQEMIDKGTWRRDLNSSWDSTSVNRPYAINMTLNLSMPIPIDQVQASHPISKTFTHNNTKAVVTLDEGNILENDFDLAIRLTSPHTPQIYLETSSDNQVVAFVLRPDFTGVKLFPDNTAFSEMTMDWGVLEVEQVPKTLRPISNMGCIIVYAVLHDVIIGREEITLRAITVDGMLSYKSLLNPLSSFDGNLLHQLVARRKVRELERLNQQQFSQERKNQIIELSLQHSITSQYTSFLISEEVRDYPDTPESKLRVVPISKSVDIRPKGTRAHDPHMNNNRMNLSPGGSPNLQNGWRSGSGGINRGYQGYNNQNSMFSNNPSPTMNFMSRPFTPPSMSEDRQSMFSNQFFPPTAKPTQYSTYPGTNTGGYQNRGSSGMNFSGNNVGNYYFNNNPNYNGNHSPSFLNHNPSVNPNSAIRSNSPFQFSNFGNRGDLLNGISYDSGYLSNGMSSPNEYSPFALKVKLELFLSHQQIDGSWTLDSELSSFVGIPFEELQGDIRPDQCTFWATALVIAYLDYAFYENFSTWEQSVEKAKVFLSQNTEPEYWIQMATHFLENRRY